MVVETRPLTAKLNDDEEEEVFARNSGAALRFSSYCFKYVQKT